MTTRIRTSNPSRGGRATGAIIAAAIAALTIAPVTASAQSMLRPSSVSGGVPSGTATQDVLPLSLPDAVKRGLDHNLAIILQEQQTRTATAGRLQALSALLPHVSANVRNNVQVLSTAAFGFTGFGGLPTLLGPFNVFDARVNMSAPLIDMAELSNFRAARATTDAASADALQVREIVVLAVANLYLQAVSDRARTTAAAAQVATAEALVRLTEDQQAVGVAARIDVLRQQVQLEQARTLVIQADNQFAKRKLELARAIGLPAGQAFDLTDTGAFTPAPPTTIDAALGIALEHRPDLKAARARADAAQQSTRAATAARFPSLRLDGDIGALGLTPSSAEKTYSLAVTVHVPIFDGANARARSIEADSAARQRNAELADLESGVRYELTAALLDLNAAEAGVRVATSGQNLARETLTQAEDRFRAGVASTVELVQAQEAVARATDQYISSVYAHNVAKAQFARALGEGETLLLTLIGGVR